MISRSRMTSAGIRCQSPMIGPVKPGSDGARLPIYDEPSDGPEARS